MRKGLFLLLLIPVCAFGNTMYIVNGEQVQKVPDLLYWKGEPFMNIITVAGLFDLKWSVKDGMGIIENGKDFISFNLKSGEGLYDSLYYIEDAATDLTSPYISIMAVAKLMNFQYSSNGQETFLVEKPPTITIKGAILYGNTFTIFFNTKPPTSSVKITNNGIVEKVEIYPVLFSPDYSSPNSPLVVEKRESFSVSYDITHTATLDVTTAVGSPTFPVQESNLIDFGNGIIYQTMVSPDASNDHTELKILELSPSVNVKMGYEKNGIGKALPLNEINTGNHISIIAFKNIDGLVYSMGHIYGAPMMNKPALTWNGQKFDIIETDQLMTVNIGNIPFVVDGVDTDEGNVILYTKNYGLDISNSKDRSYFEIENGRIVGMGYQERVADEELLSIKNIYSSFLKNVTLGQSVSFILPFNLQNVNLGIQGKVMMIQNFNRIPVFEKGTGDNGFFAAMKGNNLYFIDAENSGGIVLSSLQTLFMNMGFSDAIYLGNEDQISMIVGDKPVDHEPEAALFQFWIEIDKTTGGA